MEDGACWFMVGERVCGPAAGALWPKDVEALSPTRLDACSRASPKARNLGHQPGPVVPLSTEPSTMAVPASEISITPSDPRFHFPYATPYGIQTELQQHLYQALAKSQVTVIESPTGTVSLNPCAYLVLRLTSDRGLITSDFVTQGKSLSLLCASLTFLSDLRAHTQAQVVARTRREVAESFCGQDEPEWVMEQEVQRVLKELDAREVELEDRLVEVRRREADERDRASKRVVSRRDG